MLAIQLTAHPHDGVTTPEKHCMATLGDFALNGLNGGGPVGPELAGKVVLVVNVASQCGLTPQYSGLQQLHTELADKNFSVLGCPCNQFGAQEPGTEDEIARFCETSYQVSFPMTEKLDVNGDGKHPLYAWLTGDDGFPGDIEWNFEKFLIGRDGKIAKRYPPATTPDDKGLLQDLAELL